MILLAGLVFSTSGAGNPQAIIRQSPSEGDQAARIGRLSYPKALTQPAEAFRDFGIISNTDGWILIGRQLYWTTSNGSNWSDITPALPATATIYTASFLDTQMGWVLWSDSQADGGLVLQIERTSDQGRNWDNAVIQTLKPEDPSAEVERASMDWLNGNTGRVSVKQKTGSNFSSGTLFLTEDGGQSWQRRPLPIGDAAHFVNSQVGWTAGGPAGDLLFKTQDGGNSWQEQTLPEGIAGSLNSSLYAPVFDAAEKGLLPVITLAGNDFRLDFFSTGDAGQSWNPVSNLPLGTQAGWLPLSMLDARNLVAAIPNSDRIIQMVNGKVKTVMNQDGMSAAIVDLEMLDSDFGWAKWNSANCTEQAAADGSSNISCTSTSKLIETRDGGISWQVLAIPGNIAGTLTGRYQTASSSLAQGETVNVGKTLLAVGQGFDVCTIPTSAQLQTWWNTSPYRSVNLYIGGAARACANPTLTAAYVNEMRQQGWHFIPTWVGPQAPCTNYIKRFSSDVNTAYIQGKDEAYFATTSLAALGLTYADTSGSVVYYDMENYGSDPACLEAVKAFVNGWVTHLHDFGNLAGIYGGTLCDTGLGNYLTIPNVPDVIWPARWYLPAGQGTYDPNASVWTIGTCIPATVWNNHQRIRQYAGDHSETWGGVMIRSIDDNVLDGVVAVPYFGTPSANFTASPLVTPALTVQFTITNTAFISSCNWDYGDGQTGTSCATIHTHTYNNTGTYTVRLTVSSAWGSENPTSSITITITPPATNTPSATATMTPTTTATNTPTATNTLKPTATNTPTATETSTPTPTATNTASMTATSTPTSTETLYTLTIISDPGTVKRDNPEPYHYGDVVQLTAVPDPGWSFSHWSGDVTGTTNPISVRMNGNKTVTANYTSNQYSLFIPLIMVP